MSSIHLRGLRGLRPLNGRSVAVRPQGQSLVRMGLRLRPIDCIPALSLMQSAAATAIAICHLWRYISDGPLPFYLFIYLRSCSVLQMKDGVNLKDSACWQKVAAIDRYLAGLG